MKKTIFIVILIGSISISFAFIKDKPLYENLKILPKNTTKQQMDSIMKNFSASLGVRCTFCHVRETEGKKDFMFASDEKKEKNIARDMMKMTTKLNKKYFKEDMAEHNMIASVTCFSCHNGKERPATKPPLPQPPAGPRQ